jgi:ATP-dependent RNA helicase DeaD
MAHAKDRYEVLKRVVDMNPTIYAIVFCRTRQETKDVANKLMHDGYNADVLHGELSQNMRDDVMNRFRKKQIQLLVATDVAARGLDVNDLTHVINYNLPDDDEIYTHRSGRTGRAGKTGISVVILHSRESRKIKDIEKFSGITFTQERVPTGAEICQTQLYVLMDKIKSIEVDEKQIAPFLEQIYDKLEGLSREELIKHFVSAEFNRFLTYYKNAQDINLSHESSHNVASRRGNSTLSRLFINIGKRDNLNPARLIGLINEALDSKESEIGKIEILNNFSFFEIEEVLVAPLMGALNGVPYGNVILALEVSKEKKSGGSSRGGRSSGGWTSGGGRDRNESSRGDRSESKGGNRAYGSRDKAENSERKGRRSAATTDKPKSNDKPRGGGKGGRRTGGWGR